MAGFSGWPAAFWFGRKAAAFMAMAARNRPGGERPLSGR
jgi:hypothetical protein